VLKIDFLKIVSFSLSGHYDLSKKMPFRSGFGIFSRVFVKRFLPPCLPLRFGRRVGRNDKVVVYWFGGKGKRALCARFPFPYPTLMNFVISMERSPARAGLRSIKKTEW